MISQMFVLGEYLLLRSLQQNPHRAPPGSTFFVGFICILVSERGRLGLVLREQIAEELRDQERKHFESGDCQTLGSPAYAMRLLYDRYQDEVIACIKSSLSLADESMPLPGPG